MPFKKGIQKVPNSGRQKGVQNKATRDIKEMIAGALDKAGGQQYLYEQALVNPVAFLGLIKAIVPRDVNLGGQEGNELTIKILGYKPSGD